MAHSVTQALVSENERLRILLSEAECNQALLDHARASAIQIAELKAALRHMALTIEVQKEYLTNAGTVTTQRSL